MPSSWCSSSSSFCQLPDYRHLGAGHSLSLLGTVIVPHLLGLNINTMTLGGMTIAIGSLVDDAIIDVENVYKRLKQNHRKPREEREPVLDVVLNASIEIRASILNATLIIMVAFVPLFFLTGMEGRMLKPLGIAYIVALFVSLIVAMTITPLLCKLLLTDGKYLNRNRQDSWLTRKLNGIYEKSLEWVLRNKRKVSTRQQESSLGAIAPLLYRRAESPAGVQRGCW